jgi:thiol-disulfide isomerase/thioredoxin
VKASTASEGRAEPVKITWWQAKNFRSAKKSDICFLVVVLILAFAAIWSGNMMALQLSPQGAARVTEILDELQIPGQLPNAPLLAEDGKLTNLWSVADKPRTVVSFYAPWCSACQKELPELVEKTKEKNNLLVIIPREENAKATRQQLDNLGLKETRFFVDTSGKIVEAGKVTALPTTFLTGKNGRVLDRTVGYSTFQLHLLMGKARIDAD